MSGEQLELPLVRCRVCTGSLVMPDWAGRPTACTFCRDGVARFVCPRCGEALPLCSCFGELRGVVPTSPPPSPPTKDRRR